MTDQEAFDKVVNGLIKQEWNLSSRKKSDRIYDRNNRFCALVGENGCKSPLGHLIPEEQYSDSLENIKDIVIIIEKFSDLLCPNLDLLYDLEVFHDLVLQMFILVKCGSFTGGANKHDYPLTEGSVSKSALARLKIIAEKYELEWNHGN